MGGKSRLAAQIIPLLPEHTTYVEPFCGGCAVFFRKPRSNAEILNDADSRLITLLRVFRYHPEELLREITCLTHSRQEFRDALEHPGITDIQKVARFLLIVKAGFGGIVPPSECL
jgi:DNA adenine methylase